MFKEKKSHKQTWSPSILTYGKDVNDHMHGSIKIMLHELQWQQKNNL